jgi:hypothetical protein
MITYPGIILASPDYPFGQYLSSLLIQNHVFYMTNNLYQHLINLDPKARVRFPALPEKKVVVLERGPLSLVSTTEEILDRKVAAPV